MEQTITTIITFLIRIPLTPIPTPNHYSAHYIDHNKVWDMLDSGQSYTDSYLTGDGDDLELKMYIDTQIDVDGDQPFSKIFKEAQIDCPFTNQQITNLLNSKKYLDTSREITKTQTSIILDI